MRFTDLCTDFFRLAHKESDGTISLTLDDGAALPGKVQIEELALFSVVDLLSSAAACCEWRTYKGGKRFCGPEWYSWNIQPNIGQNGVQFRRELFARLFLSNEAVVFERNGQRYIADSFSRVADGFDVPVYESISYRGHILALPLREADVLHYRLALSPQACALRNNLKRFYSELLDEGMDKYKKSGGKSGILEINSVARGKKTFEEDLEKLLNDRFKRFFENKNAVLPLFDGYSYTPQNGPSSQKSTSEISDMRSVLEQAQTAACNAYHVPPSILRGEVTNLPDAVNSMLSFALKAPLRAVQAENNRKLYGQTAVLNGDYMRISTVGLLSVDPFAQADKVDKLVSDRIYNPDGIRELLDDEPIGEPWASTYTMTKNLEVAGGTDEK